MKSKMKGNLMLLTTAIIWGTAFVAQKEGMDLIGPIAFNGIRTVIGGIILLPVIWFMSKINKNKDEPDDRSPEEIAEAKKAENKLLIIGGIVCGLALCFAGNVQQVGLFYTTAGKAAFITPLYVMLVPVIGLIFLKKKIRPIMWLCVIAAIAGLYLLCIPAEGGLGGINKGDAIMLICALGFALHILAVDYFSPKVDGVKLSCIQFFVAGIVSCILIFPLDPALGFDIP
ncbi:MAG: DMT family transporter, partial [Firmicutes bacterium]|nr:DMT family transporter [Bacillota bacterium]